MTDATPIVELRNVHRRFGRRVVLRGVDLAFPRGLTTVVLGPSGAGKSVMLKLVVGLLRPDRGAVLFDGRRIDGLSEQRLTPVRRQVGFLFQGGALFDSLTVRENIAFPLREHAELTPAQREERVRYVAALVGMADALDRMPAELSGGQRKRIALARAIALDPALILYDEPTTGLDPIRADVINELVLRLKRELGASGIVVTHDLVSAFRVADRMVLLHEGRIRFQGTPEEIRRSADPVVQRFLRGEASDEDLPRGSGGGRRTGAPPTDAAPPRPRVDASPAPP